MALNADEERLRLKLLEQLAEMSERQRFAAIDELAEGDSERAFWLRQRAAHMLATAQTGEVESTEGGGQRIGHCETLRMLYHGSRSTVYHAWDRDCSREVVLKLPEPNAIGYELLDVEARTLSTMKHRLIIRMLQRGTHAMNGERVPFVVLEYVPPARNLAKYINEGKAHGTNWHGRDELCDRLRIFVEVCEAVHHVHSANVVHRDIKPSNILIDREGHPKLIDFGLASNPGLHAAKPEAPRLNLGAGTGHYMSPQQERQETANVADDVYSLGVVLFELASGVEYCTAGSEPFPSAENAQSFRSLPKAVQATIRTAVAYRPELRHPSAAELGAEVSAYLEHRARAPARRAVLVTLALAVALVGVLGVLLVLDSRLQRLDSELGEVTDASSASYQAYEDTVREIVSPALPMLPESDEVRRAREAQTKDLLEKALRSGDVLAAEERARIRFVVGLAFLDRDQPGEAIQYLELSRSILASIDRPASMIELFTALSDAYWRAHAAQLQGRDLDYDQQEHRDMVLAAIGFITDHMPEDQTSLAFFEIDYAEILFDVGDDARAAGAIERAAASAGESEIVLARLCARAEDRIRIVRGEAFHESIGLLRTAQRLLESARALQIDPSVADERVLHASRLLDDAWSLLVDAQTGSSGSAEVPGRTVDDLRRSALEFMYDLEQARDEPDDLRIAVIEDALAELLDQDAASRERAVDLRRRARERRSPSLDDFGLDG